MSRSEDDHPDQLPAQVTADGINVDATRSATPPPYAEHLMPVGIALGHPPDDFAGSTGRVAHDGPSYLQTLDVPSGTSTARESFVSARSVPLISLPDSQSSSRHASPKPPPLTFVNSPQQPEARASDTFQRGSDAESPLTPLEPFHPLSSIDPPLHSPTTLEASSTVNHSSTGHAESSTSILLPTFDSIPPPPPDSSGGGWTVPLNQLRPETADLDDGDYPPMRTFDAEQLSDSGKSSEAGDDVFAFQRPTTGGRANNPPNASVTGKKRKRVETSGTPAHTPFAAIDMAGHMQDIDYDPTHPPIFSGRFNLNNSPFIGFRRWREEQENEPTPMRAVEASRPPTTAISTVSSAPPPTADSGPVEVMVATRGRRVRTRDAVSIISNDTMSEESENDRPQTRHSLGMTELSGDMTVPDGHTTWGDGVGGAYKDTSDSDDAAGMEDWEEDSPYAEVRASVSNIDDPDMPALTLRAFTMGMVLCILVCAGNTFLSFRNPSPQFPILVVQVLSYPIGKFLAWCLPIREYHLPKWLTGRTFSLNPCPFNVKEHTIIVMMASVAILPAYGMYTIVSTDLFYQRPLGVGFSLVYILATQVTGLSLAGIARRFVVWPASMIWPGVLITTTILNTLHADSDIGTGGMSRLRFFLIVSSGMFAYYFLPGFLFTGLSYFSYACWMAPKNLKVNQLMGIRTGMGMGILTFDWAQIAWIGSPLAAPWWAQVNVGLGFLLFYWIITPIMYYSNVWYTKYLPITAIQPADRYQEVYNVSRVLTADHTLNVTAYAEYSPVYLTAAFTMTYMLAFALTTSLIVYTMLVHGPRIWRTMRNIPTETDDVHRKLMRKYPEVPDWWYGLVFAACFAIGIVSVKVFHTGLPVWGYLVAISIAFLYIVPIAIIYAMSNLEPTFNLIAELIPGYAFAGMPVPGMVFKTFAVQTLAEALYFVRDMKLGHYMKVPPRSMFICQMSACTVCCFVQVGIKEWMFATIPDICSPEQSALLICSNAHTVFTGSVIWGLIGPARLFSKGGIYHPQLWMLFIGAVIPFPFWLWCRKYPQSIIRHVNPSIVFSVCLMIPPASGINIASFLVVGFIFQFWMRRYSFAWWARYNYVLSAALDVGTLAGAIIVFLVLRLPKANVKWWGNTVYTRTIDWMGLAFDIAPADPGYFGPSTWKL